MSKHNLNANSLDGDHLLIIVFLPILIWSAYEPNLYFAVNSAQMFWCFISFLHVFVSYVLKRCLRATVKHQYSRKSNFKAGWHWLSITCLDSSIQLRHLNELAGKQVPIHTHAIVPTVFLGSVHRHTRTLQQIVTHILFIVLSVVNAIIDQSQSWFTVENWCWCSCQAS